MRHVRICTVGLLAAFLFFSRQQASAECGFAAAFMPESRAEHGVTAAHQSLPLGTRVVVRNQRKGRSIIVRISERSSFAAGRIIDLSSGAMSALQMDTGTPVCLEVVSYGSQKRGYQKPSLLVRLLEAVIPKPHRYAATHSRGRSAKARGEFRSAKVRHRRGHYAKAHRGSSKRYAKLHRRHPARRSRHRRRSARG